MSAPYLKVTAIRPPEVEDDGTVLRWQIDRMEPNWYPDGTTNAIIGYDNALDTDERHWVGGGLFETWDEAVEYLADERASDLQRLEDGYETVGNLAWLYGCTEDEVRRALGLPRGTL